MWYKNKLSKYLKIFLKMCWQLKGLVLILTQQQNNTNYKTKQQNPGDMKRETKQWRESWMDENQIIKKGKESEM